METILTDENTLQYSNKNIRTFFQRGLIQLSIKNCKHFSTAMIFLYESYNKYHFTRPRFHVKINISNIHNSQRLNFLILHAITAVLYLWKITLISINTADLLTRRFSFVSILDVTLSNKICINTVTLQIVQKIQVCQR